MTVGEPNLTLLKTITSSTANLQAGDTVSFQIDVGNTGATTAFEVQLADVLPSTLTTVTNLMVTSTSGGAETPSLTNNGDDWSTGTFDVPVAGTVQITFNVVLDVSVLPGESIQNTVSELHLGRRRVRGDGRGQRRDRAGRGRERVRGRLRHLSRSVPGPERAFRTARGNPACRSLIHDLPRGLWCRWVSREVVS